MEQNGRDVVGRLFWLRLRVFLFLIATLASSLVSVAAASSNEVISSSWDCATTSATAKAVFAQRNQDLHVVWVERRPTGQEVYYYKYNNASRKWSSGQPLTEGAQAANAAIAGDYRGNLHCVWEDGGRIFYRMWNATSQEWQEPCLVSGDASNPIVLCDQAPNVHIVWVQSLPGEGNTFLSHRLIDSNGKWSEASAFTPKNAYSTEPAATVDQRNGLHVVWKMTYDAFTPPDMYYAVRRAGRDWDPFQRILDGSQTQLSHPSIAADKNGYLHLVWSQREGDVFVVYYRTWRGGWEEPVQMSDPSASAVNPAIAVDDGLNGHLVWEDQRDHPASDLVELYYRRLWPLGIWSNPQRLTDDHVSSENSRPPTLEISPTTRDLHIIWCELRDGRGVVFHRIWPGQRREDATSAASKARSSIAEVQRQPFLSPEAEEKYRQALAAYQAGVDALEDFDVSRANENFSRCISLIDEGMALEELYKEKKGRAMGILLATAGAIAGVAILLTWAAFRSGGA